MPKVLVIYVRHIESMSAWLGKILSGGIFVLIGILLVEAVSRYVFNAPTTWSIEMAQFTLGTYFLLGGAYVLSRRQHIRMDAFYSRWSMRRRATTDLATFAIFAVYLIVLIQSGIDNAAFSLQFSQHSSSEWGPPLAPIKIILTVGACLLFFQGVALLIRDLAIVRGKPLE